MILVGRGGVGKTSLVNRLVHGDYNPKEMKTDGISITPWQVPIREDLVRLNIWDFGGQEIMHATHQFFLTQRSLYLLVLNAREGDQDANIEYWMRLIESFGGDSPVIIVVNKIADHVLDLNRRGLMEKFPAIKDIIDTDCEVQIHLKELQEAIQRETDRLEHLRDLFPASWFAVKEKLANLRQHEKNDFIPFSRYQTLCENSGIKESVAQDTLVHFLHDLGIVVNFSDDPRLAETHVLNPEWVTNGIYKILNAKTIVSKRGELHLADLSGILNEKVYPPRMHLFLLDLMRKFELCYEYYESTGHYLVPELLGKEEPELTEFEKADALRFEYGYNILPEGLLPRFIVRSRALNKNQPRWRTGVVLEWEGNRAAVKADAQDRGVSIAVAGPTRGRLRLLTVIRADFDQIHGSIAKLQAKAQVPIPEYSGLAVPYDDLLVYEEAKESEIPLVYNGKVVKVKVSGLLGGVEEDLRQREPTRISSAGKPVRLAFSYSHRDEELRDQLATHLKLLQRVGYLNSWHDRQIMPSDRWKDVIDDNFKQAELILLLVSADFIASDYCYEIEMRTALERESNHEARVIPIILRACDWNQAPCAKLQALPTNGKPVTSWANRDEAWNDVANGLRSTIDSIRQLGAEAKSRGSSI
jgi:internalin A